MTRVLPPYPRFGECISVLAGALDIGKAGSDVGRLAREGDFDWEKLDSVVNELLVDGCAWVIGNAARRILAPWLADVRQAYTQVVLNVPLDAVGRSDALPVLVERFFVRAVAALLRQVEAALPGPNLTLLLAADEGPVRVTLEWLDGQVGLPIEKLVFPASSGSDRVEQEKIRKWRAGIDIPATQSIRLLSKQLEERGELAERSAVWILLASALARLERTWGAPLKPLILAHLEDGGLDQRSLASFLSEMVQQVGHAWPELAVPGRKLWYDLQRTTQKSVGDRDHTWLEIGALERAASHCDPEGRTAYHYEWMKARWHVLSGQYQEALPHYDRAFQLACYRAGHQIKDLISEASCIAAFLAKKPFLKRLKHVGIALELFRRPEGSAVLEDWEIDQFAQHLPLKFPPQGRFVEAPGDLAMDPMPGLLVIDKEALSKMQPDLREVGRVRAVHFANGEVRRWPQLRLFASFGRHEEVKRLLDAGACVDDLDSSGASALLCAIQRAEATGERAALDLLLAKSHQVATLNALTSRKRLSPLMCAIDLGLPEVVEALIAQGVDVEQKALTDSQSPLYYLVSQLFFKLQPAYMLDFLSQKMVEEPDTVLRDTLRRFGVGMAGIFGSSVSGPRTHPELAVFVAKLLVDRHASRHSVSKLMRISELMLEAGANPNAPHKYPVAGRTPLMLAAESDLPALFSLMLDHGGDPLRPDSVGQNCAQIARSFGATRVLHCLER
jgi:hypothetical protein